MLTDSRLLVIKDYRDNPIYKYILKKLVPDFFA